MAWYSSVKQSLGSAVMTNSNSARRKTCTKKKVYETPADAIISSMDDFNKTYKIEHVYQCNFCGKFHLSRDPISKYFQQEDCQNPKQRKLL
jgi:hypothetical protein